MKLRARKQVEVVVGFVCDVCNENCAKEPGDTDGHTAELATLSAEWGYWSNDKDLTWHECHLCESCYEKVRRFIEVELHGKVRTGTVRE